MTVRIGVDKDNGLTHSVEMLAANAHDLVPAADLLRGEEKVVHEAADDQGVEKRPEMK